MATRTELSVALKTEWFRAQVEGTDLLLTSIRELGGMLDNSVKTKLAARDPEYSTEDGLVYRRGRIVVPSDRALRGRLIRAHHDSVIAGHPGRAKTQELIYQSHWWPSLKRDVQSTGAERAPVETIARWGGRERRYVMIPSQRTDGLRETSRHEQARRYRYRPDHSILSPSFISLNSLHSP